MNSPWLSVVIPSLNEEKRIGLTLDNVRQVFPGREAEIIVSDGGSCDRTLELARIYPEVIIVTGSPGRGRQMNRGAQAAAGEVLLFLHADAILPFKTAGLIAAALSVPGVVGGAFKIETVLDQPHTRLFKALVRTADWRSRFTRRPYGDQALFLPRPIFGRIGGFRDYPVMEDLDFSRRLSREGKIMLVDGIVRVSGRRWEKNLLGNFIKLKALPLLFRLGVSPDILARIYGVIG